MERIILIGCGGSGKSTLAVKLGEKLNLPVIHLDRLYWRSDWRPVSKPEFRELLQTELEKPRWVMDGNFRSTIPQRLEKCDTVIYLDMPRRTCMWGIIKRVCKYYGKTRPDMGENCPERISLEFIKWVWNYNKECRADNYAMLEQAGEKNIIILRSRKEVQTYLNGLLK